MARDPGAGGVLSVGITYYFLWRPQLPDPSDDLVLEVAAHGRCDGIVTFNTRDFVGSERFGITIETPSEFLRSLGDGL